MLSTSFDVKHNTWDTRPRLGCMTFAYSPHAPETTGFTCFRLVHGRHAMAMVGAMFPHNTEDDHDDDDDALISR